MAVLKRGFLNEGVNNDANEEYNGRHLVIYFIACTLIPIFYGHMHIRIEMDLFLWDLLKLNKNHWQTPNSV